MISLRKDDKNRSKDQKKKEKVCLFPECDEIFFGTGQCKYCDEHRKPQYKSVKYQKNRKNKIGDSNFLLNNTNTESIKVIRKCALEGCDCRYSIIVVPNQFIYPKFCEEHRNEFKREFFKKKQDCKNEAKK